MTSLTLLATGGTIACTLDRDGRAVKTLRAADLADRTAVPAGVRLTPVDHGLGSSWDLTPPAMLDLVRRARESAATSDGVVVPHGTDTLEETATLFALTWAADEPVVLTGAMRATDGPGGDGLANLADAAAVAADPGARGRGPLVVFAGEVHLGARVAKRHSAAPAPFGSPAGGPVGLVDGGIVTWPAPPAPRTTYDVAHADADVPLLLASPGAPVRVLEAALDGADGLVVAGMGLGHLPSSWLPLLGEAVAAGIPVVRGTRTGAGPAAGNYAGPGGDVDAEERGLLSAGYRTPAAARIELVCVLGAGADPTAAFARPLP